MRPKRNIPRDLAGGEKLCPVRVITRDEWAFFGLLRSVQNQDRMMAGIIETVIDSEDCSGRDAEPGLFTDLPFRAGPRGLTVFDESGGECPVAAPWLNGAPHKTHSALAQDYAARGRDWIVVVDVPARGTSESAPRAVREQNQGNCTVRTITESPECLFIVHHSRSGHWAVAARSHPVTL